MDIGNLAKVVPSLASTEMRAIRLILMDIAL